MKQTWIQKSGRLPIACPVLPDEHKLIRRAAAELGVSMSQFVREGAILYARRILKSSPKVTAELK